MNRVTVKVLVMSAIFLTGAVAGFAEDTAPDGQSELSVAQKAIQARMENYTTPNEYHKFLETLAGRWQANVKFWMEATSVPQESEGTSEANMVMGGRFLEQKFTGTFMGQPFEGRGIYGYDNLRKEYTSIWFDNMATGIMTSAGGLDANKKVMTEEGSMSCPITDEEHRWYKAVTTIIDPDHYTYETFMRDAAYQEFRAMFISYSRTQ